jgi:hypothetical protein
MKTKNEKILAIVKHAIEKDDVNTLYMLSSLFEKMGSSARELEELLANEPSRTK